MHPSNSKLEYLIIGAGGQGRVVASILIANGGKIKGFLDPSFEKAHEQYVLNYPMLGNNNSIKEYSSHSINLALGIGDNLKRKEFFSQIVSEHFLNPIIHPSAKLELNVEIDIGSVIAVGAIICVEARIGKAVIINSGSIIEHECQIHDFCHISPGVQLGGRVTIGECTHIGIGATVIDKVNIGKNSIIGAGSVVINDIPDNVIAVGVPARIIKNL